MQKFLSLDNIMEFSEKQKEENESYNTHKDEEMKDEEMKDEPESSQAQYNPFFGKSIHLFNS